MRILGIDPGFGTVGFAIIEVLNRQKKIIEMGTIKTDPNLEFGSRLLEIYKDIQSILKEYKPEAVAIEKVFFTKNITTGIQVSQAKGVILLALAEAGMIPRQYSPSEMKASLTGNGKADKKSIQKMLSLEFGIKEAFKQDDASDALSLALTLSFELRC